LDGATAAKVTTRIIAALESNKGAEVGRLTTQGKVKASKVVTEIGTILAGSNKAWLVQLDGLQADLATLTGAGSGLARQWAAAFERPTGAEVGRYLVAYAIKQAAANA
jgi:hypothetical protein